MADKFTLSGSFRTEPQLGVLSAIPTLDAPIDEVVALAGKSLTPYTLAGDAPVAVNFGGLTEAHVVIIKTLGGKIRVRLTSADGDAQSVPVDSLLVLISQTAPVTAVDLTREAGRETQVFVFIGER